MALPKELLDTLNTIEALKTIKIGEKQIVDFLDASLTPVIEKAEASFKLQDANKDLVAQREESKAKMATLQSQINEYEKKMKAGFQEGFNTEGQLKYNKLLEDVSKLTEELTLIRTGMQSEKERSSKLELANMQKDQMAKLTNLLSNTENQITGDNLDLALTIIKDKGYASIIKNDDGSLKEIYMLPGDKGNKPASLTEIAQFITKKYPNLVSGTGSKGTGTKHTGNGNNSNGWGKTLQEMRQTAKEQIKGN